MKRPAHLTIENASRFKEKGLVDVYHHRLPYPTETFDLLLNLIRDDERTVLDVGTGIGNLARGIVSRVKYVDAIDFSQTMIATGKKLPNGDAPNLNWIVGRAEEVIPAKQYSLIMAGDSLHWMDWDVIFSMFADHLLPVGVVAWVTRIDKQPPWHGEVIELVKKYSLYQNFEYYDFIQLIQDRGHFELIDDEYTPYYAHQQTIEQYIASWHSRGSLSPETMPVDHLQQFDNGVREIVTPHCVDGVLNLNTRGRVSSGKPLKN